MIRIDAFDYFSQINNGESELIGHFPEIKKELESLEEINELIENFEKNSIFHSNVFLKRAKNQHLAVKIKILNSELKEKNEINERLQSLGYNLGLLRMLQVVKDDKAFKKIKESFLTNDYSSIPVIIKELNNSKEKIDELENDYKALINQGYASIDFKVRHEHELDEHLKSLNNIHKKQKQLLKSMAIMFVKLSKNLLKQKI